MSEQPDIVESCPFCDTCNGPGATPIALSMTRLRAWYVNCDGCGADGPIRDTEAEAIAAWNRRDERLRGSPPADMRDVAIDAVAVEKAARDGRTLVTFGDVAMARALVEAYERALASTPAHVDGEQKE